jgi:N-acyl-D-aspartate/D-glutamate deacylase
MAESEPAAEGGNANTVLRGGRVIDPESGFDAVADVAIGGGRVTQVGPGLPAAPAEVDAAGLVVTAGFVDLHSHVNDLAGLRLQALDGVTTALELEAGASPVAAAYRAVAAQGRPVNYGFAASWAQARMTEVGGFAPDADLAQVLGRLGHPGWQRPATPGQLAALLSRLAGDPADRALLMRSLTFPGAVVASDAMPLTWHGPADPLAWPPGPSAMTHPRTAGTFGRAMRLLTHGEQALSLAQALGKCSLEPARLLEEHVPAMRRKGRLRPGADADLVLFDPATLTDRATYADSTRPSEGIIHVLVNGAFVVRDGSIVPDARPGRPVRAEPR